MKNIRIFFIISVFTFISCETTSSSSSFFGWYEPWRDVNNMNNVISLKENEQPRIIKSNNIDEEYYDILAEYYYCIGETSFNGTASTQNTLIEDIKKQCIQNGATLALYSIEYTDTRSGVIGTGGNVSSYNIRRYDYTVYYFVAMASIPDILIFFGADCMDLNNDLRRKSGRNTGAYVRVVYKNSPAFYANLFRSDVIIRIDKNNINNSDEIYDILRNYYSGDIIEVEYFRNNIPYITNIKLQ